MNRKDGFTLIELLIVVAIIGVLAAIAIPNLLNALARTRQKRTMADMRTIALAWEQRNSDVSRYNAAALGFGGVNETVNVDDLTNALTPTYVRTIPKNDGWGTAFQCYTDQPWGSSSVAGRYVIMSAGADRIFNTPTVLGATTNFDCDIVYSGGMFVVYPDGVQTQ